MNRFVQFQPRRRVHKVLDTAGGRVISVCSRSDWYGNIIHNGGKVVRGTDAIVPLKKRCKVCFR